MVSSTLPETLDNCVDEIIQAIRSMCDLELHEVQVHGDFYSGNLKAMDGRITAIFDWDETRVEWRAWEIGRAAWEFCKTANGTLDPDAAVDFVEAYIGAGAGISHTEKNALVTLMRADILWGVLYSFGHAQREVDAERGIAMDWDYHIDQLAAMERLREIHLF